MKTRRKRYPSLDSIGAIAAVHLLVLATGASLADVPGDGSAAKRSVDHFFGEMTDLLHGRWTGEYANGTIDAPVGDWTPTMLEYTATAGGSALIENFVGESGNVYMSTVYHKDNQDLRATHYCGARNHPRMVARTIDAEEKIVFFDFVDITNLKSADSYHSRSLELKILDKDSIVLTFTGLEGGAESSRVFRFRRDREPSGDE